MSEREEPRGPTNPLLHHQAGVMQAMLDAMHKEDKAMVLSYLGLMEIEDAPPPEARKMGDTKKKQ